MARDPSQNSCGGEAAKGSGITVAHPDRQRLDAKRTHLSRGDFEDPAARAARAEDGRIPQWVRDGFSRSLDARRPAVEGDPPVQGVRVDLSAAMPLAMHVLSESRARPDQRLDGRDL